MNLEIAAEYVAMAAHLLQIKSRLMLPRPPQAAGEEDPREALVQRLPHDELAGVAIGTVNQQWIVHGGIPSQGGKIPARRGDCKGGARRATDFSRKGVTSSRSRR